MRLGKKWNKILAKDEQFHKKKKKQWRRKRIVLVKYSPKNYPSYFFSTHSLKKHIKVWRKIFSSIFIFGWTKILKNIFLRKINFLKIKKITFLIKIKKINSTNDILNLLFPPTYPTPYLLTISSPPPRHHTPPRPLSPP